MTAFLIQTKPLPKTFDGRGQVKGYRFEQIDINRFACIYRVIHIETGSVHYEVFKRKTNTRFVPPVESYPTDKAFGIWAWTYRDVYDADQKFGILLDEGMETLKPEWR